MYAKLTRITWLSPAAIAAEQGAWQVCQSVRLPHAWLTQPQPAVAMQGPALQPKPSSLPALMVPGFERRSPFVIVSCRTYHRVFSELKTHGAGLLTAT